MDTDRPAREHVRLPSTDSLRCFAAAAQSLNFRAASRTVGLTPQAFSHRIHALEEELGGRLFERTTRSVQLTLLGLALRPVADRALVTLKECALIAHGPAQAATPLLLGTRHELGLSWIEPNLPLLEKRLPTLQLHLYFGSGRDLLQQLRARDLDGAITSSRVNTAELVGLPLHREDYVFAASPAYLRKMPLSRAGQAGGHTLIDIDDSLPLYRYWREAREQNSRVAFGRLWKLGTGEAVRRAVVAGRGVAVLPRYMVEGDLKARRLVAIFRGTPLLHDFFRLFVRADDARRPLFEALAQALRKLPLR